MGASVDDFLRLHQINETLVSLLGGTMSAQIKDGRRWTEKLLLEERNELIERINQDLSGDPDDDDMGGAFP